MTGAAEAVINNVDAFTHMRIINGMGISLCLSRLLIFASRFIQHPTKNKVSYVHIGWVLLVLLWIVQFWWDYLLDSDKKTYDMLTYIMELLYVFGLFFICVTLTPDDVKEYGDYEKYFFSRRQWLFALFIFINIIQSVEQIRIELNSHEVFSAWFLSAILALETIFILIAMKIKRKNFQFVFMGLLYLTTMLDFLY
jgi:hypothetical protein